MPCCSRSRHERSAPATSNERRADRPRSRMPRPVFGPASAPDPRGQGHTKAQCGAERTRPHPSFDRKHCRHRVDAARISALSSARVEHTQGRERERFVVCRRRESRRQIRRNAGKGGLQVLEDLIEESTTRRDVFKAIGATALAGALLGAAGFDPAIAQELKPSGKPLKAAMGNAGLQATWCAQGKQAAEAWGKLMNVEITWFDGELSATKQRVGGRQSGHPEMGFRGAADLRHRHAQRPDQEGDRLPARRSSPWTR